MDISIIIPVLNVEKYVGHCLDSLLSCDLTGCEILLVLGDSTDSSNEICQAYEERFSQIRTIRQSGTGLSNARNCGHDATSGEFLIFIDSDDYVKSTYFSDLLGHIRKHTQADVFVTDFNMVTEDPVNGILEHHIYQIGEGTVLQEGMAFLPQMLKKKQCFWNVWRYAYRRSFLDSHRIRFKENFLCEDVDFTTKVFMAEPEIVFMHCPYYCYRVAQSNSLMGQVSQKRIADTATILAQSIYALDASRFPWRQNMIEQYQFELILNLALLYEFPKQEQTVVQSIWRDALPALKVGQYRVAHTMYQILNVAGIPPVADLLYILKQIKRKVRKLRMQKQK